MREFKSEMNDFVLKKTSRGTKLHVYPVLEGTTGYALCGQVPFRHGSTKEIRDVQWDDAICGTCAPMFKKKADRIQAAATAVSLVLLGLYPIPKGERPND